MDSSVIGPATLAASQGFSAFVQFLPRISDVRKADPTVNADMRGDVRFGELAAASVTIGTGLIVSALTKSNVPTMVSIVVSLGFIALYESALRGNRPFNTPIRERNSSGAVQQGSQET